MKFSIEIIIFSMLALGGTLFLVIAWRSWDGTLHILKNGTKTGGTVVGNALRPQKIGERSRPNSLAPVVQFQTADGQIVRYFSQTYTNPPQHAVGDVVEIWYLPADPQTATLKGPDAWVFPGVFAAFGLAMCLIGCPTVLRTLFSFLKNQF